MTKRKNDFDDVINNLKKLKIEKEVKPVVKSHRSEPIYNYTACSSQLAVSYVDRKWKY